MFIQVIRHVGEVNVRQNPRLKKGTPVSTVPYYKWVTVEREVESRLTPDPLRQTEAQTKRERKIARRLQLDKPRYHPQFLREIGRRKKAHILSGLLQIGKRQHMGTNPLTLFLRCEDVQGTAVFTLPALELYNGLVVYEPTFGKGTVKGGVTIERHVEFKDHLYIPGTQIFWEKKDLRDYERRVMQVA